MTGTTDVYSNKDFSKEELEKLDLLNADADQLIKEDKRFFEIYPDRKYRIRVCSAAEHELAEMLAPRSSSNKELQDEFDRYVIVTKVSSEKRIRAILIHYKGNDCNISDEEIEQILNRFKEEDSSIEKIENIIKGNN